MRAGNEEILDEVRIFEIGCTQPLPAASLNLVSINRQTLYIAVMRDCHHHHIVGDEVFHIEAAAVSFEDGRATCISIFLFEFQGLFAHHFHSEFTAVHQGTQSFDEDQEFVIFLLDLLQFHAGETL